MASEQHHVAFGEICEHSAFGPRFSSDEYASDGNVACLRTTDIRADGRIDFDAMPLAKLDLSRLRNHILRRDDLVITRTGAYLGKAAVFSGFRLPVLAGAFSIYFRLNREIADPLFIRYFFNSSIGQEAIHSIATGSAQPNLNIPNLHSLRIPLPSLAEQRAIANILGVLDDKIELNRRMNETLEGLARAIFQSWFVDFDPVRAQRDGLPPPALSPAIAALFPDSFEDSELGKIPKGWVIDTIKNRASNVQYGYTQSASLEPVGPRFLRITDIRGGQVDWSAVPFCKTNDDELEKYRIKDGDIFVARTGTSTGDNIYVIDPPDAVFASYLVRFQFASVGIGRFVGEFMRTPDYFSHVAGSIGGSAQPNASAQTLADATVVFPTEVVADQFYKTVRPLDLKRTANSKESERLAAIRDALLPKLLSGEIRVAEAERLVEETT